MPHHQSSPLPEWSPEALEVIPGATHTCLSQPLRESLRVAVVFTVGWVLIAALGLSESLSASHGGP